MKLLTEELKKKLPALYSQENVEDPMVVAKFFDPSGSWTWYATEGSPVCPDHNNYDCTVCPKPWDGDFLFFGLVDGLDAELGYFSLAELESVKGAFGLGIERDIYWEPKKLSEVQEKIGARC